MIVLKKIFILSFAFIPLFGFCQKSTDNHVQASYLELSKTRSNYLIDEKLEVNERDIYSFLIKEVENISSDNRSELLLQNTIASPAGLHYTYSQTFNGIEVYNGQVKLNQDTTGKVRSLFDNTFSTNNLQNHLFPTIQWINDFEKNLEGASAISWELVYFPTREDMLPAVCFTIKELDHSYYEKIFGSKGELLHEKDLNRYNLQDSLVDVGVFNPDPLTTALTSYGAPYVDNGDSDVPELLAEIDTHSVYLDYDNGTFSLKGPYAEIKEFSNPVTTPATSLAPSFFYTRSESEFEDVNCYYHITVFQEYIQSLGFNNLVNFPIEIDPHALNGQDNSMFSGNQLYFGEGGVDDAEDADVVIHEYGHAISASAAPNTWNGFERQAMDEGLGDYLATSYGRDINPHNWADMFSWDGHNEFWGGRTVVTSKTYPGDLGFSIHSAGEIWASTLMQIWESIGKEATDKLMLQSLYGYASNMSMTDAAYLFLDADSLLNNGANYFISYYWFEQRGILPPYPNLMGLLNNNPETSCSDTCDAYAVMNGMNGTPPYSYEWRDEFGQSIGQNVDSAIGLCIGNYSVLILDAIGDSVLVPVGIAGPDSLKVDFVVEAEQCATCDDGLIVSVVSGGTPPYSYLWSDPLAQTTVIASGLDAGNYTLQVQDANGCTFNQLNTVNVPMGLEDLHRLEAYVVYPNPTSGKFMIDIREDLMHPTYIKVSNGLGQVLYYRSFSSGLFAKKRHQIDLGNYGNGVYYIEVQSERGRAVEKLIVF